MQTRSILMLSFTWLFVTAVVVDDARAASYEQVAPILRDRCVLCHAGPAAPLGLRLDSIEGVLAGSERGPVVKAGDAGASELVRRIRGESLPRMPMTGPPFLSDVEIGLIEAWIDAGALVAAVATPQSTPVAVEKGGPPDYGDVAAILATRCTKCHATQGLMGAPPEDFLLTSHGDTLAFDDRARVIPGDPGASELLRRVKGQALPRMPLDGPPFLDNEEIALIEAWIAAGARDGLGDIAPMPVGAEVRLHGRLDSPDSLDGWRFQSGAGTRRDKSPRVGDYVQLRGQVLTDGSVYADRLRTR